MLFRRNGSILRYHGFIQIAWNPGRIQRLASVGYVAPRISDVRADSRVHFGGFLPPIGLLWGMNYGLRLGAPDVAPRTQSPPAELIVIVHPRRIDQFGAVDRQERFVGE